jgi:pimeloyl-ACP methyl ester carboxylesterase
MMHLPLHSQTVAVGLGGHGASPDTAAKCSVERYGVDVAEVIRALALPSAMLAGHSMGCEASGRQRCSHQTKLPVR